MEFFVGSRKHAWKGGGLGEQTGGGVGAICLFAMCRSAEAGYKSCVRVDGIIHLMGCNVNAITWQSACIHMPKLGVSALNAPAPAKQDAHSVDTFTKQKTVDSIA